MAAYLGNRFDIFRTDELIVFLWAQRSVYNATVAVSDSGAITKPQAFQRLVLPRSSTAFLSSGLHKAQQCLVCKALNQLSLNLVSSIRSGIVSYSLLQPCRVLLNIPDQMKKTRLQ